MLLLCVLFIFARVIISESTCGTRHSNLTLSNTNETNPKFMSCTCYDLTEGQHRIFGILKLHHLHNITFRGAESKSTEIILHGPTAKIMILNSTFIKFQDIKIVNWNELSSEAPNTYLIINTSKYFYIINVSFTHDNHNESFSRFLNISNSNVNLNNCTFQNGYNKIGGAITASQSNLTFSGFNLFKNNGAHYTAGGIYGRDCTTNFTGTSNFIGNSASEGGAAGAIYGRDCTMNFTGTSNFIGNSASEGGAIYLYNGSLILTETIEFNNNTGLLGGALFLTGGVQTRFKSTANVSFINNNADSGGAVYIPDPIHNQSCFFEPEALNITSIQIKFEENCGETSDGAIFRDFLETCHVEVNDSLCNINGSQYLNMLHDSSSFSSKAIKVCFCTKGNPDCSTPSKNEILSPGKTLTISVVPVGPLNFTVPAFISSAFHSSHPAEVHPETHNIYSNSKCHDMKFRVLMSEMVDNLTLFLYPEHCCISNRILSVTVKKKTCPPGFQYQGNTCICNKNLTGLTVDNQRCVTDCDINREEVTIPENIWIKKLSGHEYVCGRCPLGYCNSKSMGVNLSSLSSDSLCNNNRTGKVCGACKKNFSLVLNSLNCEDCDKDSYYTLVIIFFVAGIALIAVLLLLQMTVAHGTINGLILYCNVIGICTHTFWPADQKTYPPLPVFVSWVNLNFGISRCFYHGLDHYAYTWLQIVFPLYLWALIGLIVVGCKISSRIAKMFGSNPIAVLATVILMSFTKLLQTAEQALSYNNLTSTRAESTTTWEMDSNIDFFKKEHIGLVLLSIGIIFLLLPYIVLLTFGYHLQKFSGRRGFRWFNSFKPLLDAYYAPYQKNRRYWTGLLLLIRSCFFLILPILRESNAVLVTVTSLFSVLMAFAWLKGPIYDSFFVEVLEVSFVVNLCLLGVASSYAKMAGDRQLPVTYASTGVAFTEFIGILLFHIVLRICKKVNPDFEFSCANVMKLLRRKMINNNADPETKIENKTTMMIPLREPLLEDSSET